MTLYEEAKRTLRGLGDGNDDDDSDVRTGDLAVGCIFSFIIIPLLLILYAYGLIAIKNWH